MPPSQRSRVSFNLGSGHPLAGVTVLQIIPELETGGAERTAVDVAEGLAAVGARALVACEGGRLVGELQSRGGEWVPFRAKTKNPFAMLRNVRRLARIAHDEKVSLIHARSRAPAWVGLGAARSLDIPFVTTFHGSYSGGSAPKRLYNSVMARGDIVIANSNYTSDLIGSLYPSAKPRIRVIHRGTDLASFAPSAVEPGRVDALRRAWGLGSHERIVLVGARLTAWKGQKVLIEAASLLRGSGLDDIAYILAGDPQGRDGYVAELDGLIAAKGLKGIVRRVGHCSDMEAAFLAASVVAVPSIEPEAFGRAAVEAQALGAPVVVSDLGAVPETVLSEPASSRTGWRVPAGDAPALAAALAEALSLGASARAAMALRARAHVERHFSLEQMVAATLDTYMALLSPPAEGG